MFRRDLSSTSGQSLNGGGFIIFTGFDFVWSFRSMLYQGSLLPSFEATVVAIHIACNVQSAWCYNSEDQHRNSLVHGKSGGTGGHL